MKPAPLCRCCGKPIAKKVVSVWLHRPKDGSSLTASSFQRHVVIDSGELPKTKAQCAPLTNGIVVSTHRSKPQGREIYRFGEWDGESYVDRYFCKNECARRFGYLAAKEGEASGRPRGTIEWVTAVARQPKEAKAS